MQQRELEALTRIPQSTLSRLLQPEKGMSLQQLDTICTALNLDIGEVLRTARTDSLALTGTPDASPRAVAGAGGTASAHPTAPAPGDSSQRPAAVHGQSRLKRRTR